jgi:hypothetical protein
VNEIQVLLNTYYEILHERLEAHNSQDPARLASLLQEEIARRSFEVVGAEKFKAYLEATQAFVAERIETYNPVGIQYTFGKTSPEEAWEFETQLNWYDSRGEFETLVKTARTKLTADMSPEKLRQSARELIWELGAYPDKSIIEGYQGRPTLQKLPDYVVARVVEEIVRQEDEI